jgi:hypothetical protein
LLQIASSRRIRDRVVDRAPVPPRASTRRSAEAHGIAQRTREGLAFLLADIGDDHACAFLDEEFDHAWPSPRDPPVTIATLPASSFAIPLSCCTIPPRCLGKSGAVF